MSSRILSLSLITLIIISLVIVTHLGHAQSGPTVISGKFYRFDVVAEAGQGSLTDVSQSPSLNDNGVVAFTGVTTAGNGIYLSDVSGATLRNITSSFTATNRFFTPSPQINNSNQVVAHERVVDSQVRHLLRRWDGSPMNPVPATIIAGANFPGFNDFAVIYPFAGINNNNQAAFNAQKIAGQTVTEELVTGLRPNFNRLSLPNAAAALRPMVADDGRVVVRAGGLTTHPILLYQYNLTAPVSIASSPAYTTLGRSPGISDDGQAVVFYGVDGSGAGIFISLDLGAPTRQVSRIAGGRPVENIPIVGGNDDGVCDDGESCKPGELGFTAAGGALSFSSFEADSRVAVTHQSFGDPALGLKDDAFVISFIGTPSAASSAPQYFSNQKGLWTIRIDIKQEAGGLKIKPSTAIPVVQINDTIGTKTVTNVAVYDQIANAITDDAGTSRTQQRGDHKVAFWAATNSGNIIVRGSHLDSDGDGLLNHWETMGIDFDGNGGAPDLALHQPPFNANPNRKDIFVEIDYLQESGHTHRPDRTPSNTTIVGATVLQAVTDAFAAAPAPNPVGSPGITLHPIVDESLLETAMNKIISFELRRPGVADDFDDLKLGSNGTPAGNMCGNATTDGHFGTSADRMSANCLNILGARRLAFRYTIFGHDQFDDPGSSGLAEFHGNDLLISLRVRELNDDFEDQANDYVTTPGAGTTTFDKEWADIQAATFMHELGHTLFLRHGGGDEVNCKPSYLSVMRYGHQWNAFGVSVNLPGSVDGRPTRTHRPLDYSRGQLAQLIEASLHETNGIGGPSGQRTLFGIASGGDRGVGPSSGPINWNGNPGIDPMPINNADINFIAGIVGCPASPGQTLDGYNDWENLVYGFRTSQDFSDGGGRNTIRGEPEEDFVSLLDAYLGGPDYDGDGITNINDNCKFISNPSQADGDGDGIGDVCDSVFADLSLTKADSPDPVLVGSPLTYTITVSNGGPDTALGVVMTDELPAGIDFVSASSTQGPCSGGSTVGCDIGTMASGASATVTIVVTPISAGVVTNTAGVGSNITDPNTTNNSATTTTLVITPDITIRDARVTEPAAGQADMIFTVVLSTTSSSDVTVNFQTANGGSNPATAGADYTTTSGSITFNAGQRVKTIAIPVLSDADNTETDETFFVNLTGATGGNIVDGQGLGTIAVNNAPGAILISELRTSGPAGADDDFVEVSNNSNTPLTIQASDASAGVGLFKMGTNCDATPELIGTIPNGTVIPARGHYLFVGSTYSGANYGGAGASAGNATLTNNIENDRNLALFSTTDTILLATVNRLDAVGFSSNTGGNICDLLREGTNLQPAQGSTAEHSFVRFAIGPLQDTNNNAADFFVVSTNPTVAVGSNPLPLLGAPGPENLASPVDRNLTINAGLVDPGASSTVAPNRVRDTNSYTDNLTPSAPNGGPPVSNPYTMGTLAIRRKFTNNTGGNVTRLRFRIVDITVTNTPGVGLADVRALTSADVTVNLVGGGAALVRGLTLEQPPTQARGGGMNSSLAAGIITLGSPLASGDNVNVNFLLGVAGGGSFRFFINIEALP